MHDFFSSMMHLWPVDARFISTILLQLDEKTAQPIVSKLFWCSKETIHPYFDMPLSCYSDWLLKCCSYRPSHLEWNIANIGYWQYFVFTADSIKPQRYIFQHYNINLDSQNFVPFLSTWILKILYYFLKFGFSKYCTISLLQVKRLSWLHPLNNVSFQVCGV